ncbi:hypothetical protein K3495_g3956 [Podosphaera aphanis]|nr:hypothetical protein K3495_g3956 [Podosphaera aphanis]
MVFGDNFSQHSSEPLQDEKNLVQWLENQPDELHAQLIQQSFINLLNKLSQRGLASTSNTCNGLCYFIEQCRNSKHPTLRRNIHSENICLALFTYYLEWSEKNQHRSMRRVLELVSTLILSNSDRQELETIKLSILKQCICTIGHEQSKPLVKPAFRSLEHLMRKGTISTSELITAYGKFSPTHMTGSSHFDKRHDSLWDSLVAEVFDWMSVPDISPIAGKFLVTIFCQTRNSKSLLNVGIDITAWQTWIKRALEKEPDLLETLKNYLLPSLFSLDRTGSLEFLEDLNKEITFSQTQSEIVDSQALLKLAAFEVGKKTGLAEEPAIVSFHKLPKKVALKTITLNEDLFDPLLAHKNDLVRSLSFSALASSSSPLRPLSLTAIRIMRSKLYILYSDIDVKFRNEVLSTIKKLIERLRGSTAFLVKEIDTRKFQTQNHNDLTETQKDQTRHLLRQAEDLLQHQETFVEWWFEFLQGELIPTASYQRHITSLKTIYLWLGSGILNDQCQITRAREVISENKTAWPFTINLFTQKMTRLLMDLLVDPFEDVRTLAHSILKTSSPSKYMERNLMPLAEPEVKVEPLTKGLGNLSVAEHLESGKDIIVSHSMIDRLHLLADFIKLIREVSDKTGRADYADGFARSYELLYHLQTFRQGRTKILTDLIDELTRKVAIAENNLTQAVEDVPLHGNLAALNLIWDSIDFETISSKASCNDEIKWLQKLQNAIVDTCSRIWLVVKPVLCNDSPEGHLPEEFEELDTIDTKDVLSYSFRAIHESSNLLRTILKKNQYHHGRSHIIPRDVFAKIGDLSFEKLSTLRHRGAFSTVSLTFSVCCKLAPGYRQSDSPDQKDFLLSWLENAFVCLETQVSTTRRSAGIPSIITAIMSALPATDFEKNIRKLLQISRREVENLNFDQEQLPQVHALNSLKDLIKSVTTSARVDAHISECFEVVGQSLSSSEWAIRNSALILLRSLIDKLIGTSDSKLKSEAGWDGKSIMIRYEKYPALPRILMQLLQYENKDLKYGDSENHSVLPALGIIRRAGPPPEFRDGLYRLLFKLLGSKTWHLREQAARTISTLQSQRPELQTVISLLDYTGKSINYHHGSVLTAKLIVLDKVKTTSYTLDQFHTLYQRAFTAVYQVYNPFILVEYIELANAIFELILHHPELKTIEQRDSYILRISKDYWSLDSSKNFERHLTNVGSYSKMIVPIYIQGYLKQSILTSILLNDSSAILKIVEEMQNYGAHPIIAALKYVVATWKSIMSEEIIRVILVVLIKILETSKEADIIGNILEVTSQILSYFKTLVKTQSKLIHNLLKGLGNSLLECGGSPKLFSLCYALCGYTSLFRLDSIYCNEEKGNYIRCWVRSLERSSQADQDLDLRYSAAAAIKSFYLHYPQDQIFELESQFLEINYILMTLLVDDDEDVRGLSASAVSNILGRLLAPIAARDALFKYQVAKARRFEHFGWYCIHNLLKFDFSKSKHDPVEPKVMLQTACTVDYSLFAIEEQNLFSDPCSILDLASKAFLEYCFTTMIHNSKDNVNFKVELHTLLDWAAAGFAALQQRYPVAEDSTYTINQQSFITSLPSVFLSIRRIIVSGKTAQAYWIKNLESIERFRQASAEGTALVETWEKSLVAINHGLAAVPFQSDIHESLRSLAAQPLEGWGFAEIEPVGGGENKLLT